MKKITTKRIITVYIIYAALLSTAFSCEKSPTDTTSTGSSGPKPNVIQGTIYDAHGNRFSIPNAVVEIHAYALGNIGDGDQVYNARMDANGHYAFNVHNNTYAVHCRAQMLLNGRMVTIDLKPLDGKSDDMSLPSAPGIVRDFALQLTGEIPGGDPGTIQGYYGAKLWFADGLTNFSSTGYWENLATKYLGATVKFTLTPGSALIDGTQGKTIQLEATTEDLKNGKWFVNIPYALYHVTAVLVKAGGQQDLSLSLMPNVSNSFPTVDLTFAPDDTDPFGRPGNPQVLVWE